MGQLTSVGGSGTATNTNSNGLLTKYFKVTPKTEIKEDAATIVTPKKETKGRDDEIKSECDSSIFEMSEELFFDERRVKPEDDDNLNAMTDTTTTDTNLVAKSLSNANFVTARAHMNTLKHPGNTTTANSTSTTLTNTNPNQSHGSYRRFKSNIQNMEAKHMTTTTTNTSATKFQNTNTINPALNQNSLSRMFDKLNDKKTAAATETNTTTNTNTDTKSKTTNPTTGKHNKPTKALVKDLDEEATTKKRPRPIPFKASPAKKRKTATGRNKSKEPMRGQMTLMQMFNKEPKNGA